MKTPHIYKTQGMHCASCAHIIEKTLGKISGVGSVSVNSGTEETQITFTDSHIPTDHLNDALRPLGYSLESMQASAHMHMNHTETENAHDHGPKQDLHTMKSDLYGSLPLAVISIFIMIWDVAGKYDIVPIMPDILYKFFHHLLPLFATYIFATIGKPYILGVYRFLRYGKANMDTLIGIGTAAAFLYSFVIAAFEDVLAPYVNVSYTYYDVTIVVITFVTLGKYLEKRSKLRTEDAVKALLNLQTKTAIVIRNGVEIEISVEDVTHGDIIIVKPGQKIPVDGTILDGSSFIDESMITGEPMPVEKSTNAHVIAGTINTSGTFTFTATKIGKETLLSQIIDMVKNAQNSKAPIHNLADKISAVFVPVVLVIALVSLLAWLFIGIPTFGLAQTISFALTSFVGVLVIACPCALGLATPTAVIVGIGKGAQEGILIKDAATLETLHKAQVIVMDKTGTLTKGFPEVTKIENTSDLPDHELLSILATLESRSEHPISHALQNYVQKNNIFLKNMTHFENIRGKGVTGIIDGTTYYAGNKKLPSLENVHFDASRLEKETANGMTPILITNSNTLLGIVYVSDPIKDEAKETIDHLHALDKKVILLTGDHKNTGNYVARSLGIDEVIAEVLPQDKLRVIKELQEKGMIVAMVGDGINDAPALAQADVGISMSTGTDVAIASAGITLLHGDISRVAKAIRLSQLTMRGIKQNLFWAFIYNIIGIPLAAGALYPIFGWLLSPVFAGFAMAFSSVSVVTNSLRIKAKKL